MPSRASSASSSPPRSPQSRLGDLLRLERHDLWVLALYGLVIGLLTLVVPFAVQALVNTAGFGTLLQPLLVLAGLVLLGLAFSSLVQAVQAHVIEMLQRRVFVRVASDLAWQLPRARIAAFDQHNGPELVNRFFDVMTIQKGAAALLLDGLSILIQAGIGLLLVSLYHPALLLYSLLVAAALAAVVIGLGRQGPYTAIKESKAKYAVAAWLEEVARHPVAFRSEGGPALAAARTDTLLQHYLSTRHGHFRVLMRQIISLLALYTLASSLLLGVGGWLVMQGQLSLGQLVAAEFIVTVIIGGFAKLGKQLENFYDLLASLDKLGALTDLPLESSGPSRLPVLERPMAVALRGVSFSYPEGPPTLADIDMVIAPGEHVGILAGHGAGKSTLLDLLFGLREPQSGTVVLDDVTLGELDRVALRAQAELVREVEAFEGSVLENVRMGRAHVSEAAARDALALVGLLDRVNALPGGLHTPLFTGGAPLSPGEARHLVLARAIAGRPRLLLLDEALGHLNPASESRILDHLFAPDAPWTLVAATYNRRALGRCQRVFTLRDGALRAAGPEDEANPTTRRDAHGA